MTTTKTAEWIVNSVLAISGREELDRVCRDGYPTASPEVMAEVRRLAKEEAEQTDARWN
jgi:hypothetical protein